MRWKPDIYSGIKGDGKKELISTMATSYTLNPERVAYYEAAGWRAYYDHKWIKLLRLIVGLCQEQFGIPFPLSLLAGYYTTRASAAWVPEMLRVTGRSLKHTCVVAIAQLSMNF
jgi:hypothetical protein